jgi:hypothetical protein
MVSRGTFWDRKEKRRRHKFVCPIRGSKKFAASHPYCPWFHPQFVKGSGCYKNIRIDADETIRQSIDYGSESFKKDYNRRTSSERIFSRHLSILMQRPTVRDYVLQPIVVPSLILPFWRLLILPILSKNQIKFVLLRVFLPAFIS